MSNIHWDYADIFSGREAAYLIVGLDPSSNNPEDAYKAQSIIKKLKTAYYFACSEIRKNTDREDREEDFWGWLHDHAYDKTELLSVELEALLINFSNSGYVKKGILARLEAEDARDHNDFPNRPIEIDLERKLEALLADIRTLYKNSSPESYIKYEAIRTEIEMHVYPVGEISFNAYHEKHLELRARRDELWSEMKARAQETDPLHDAEYFVVEYQLEQLGREKSDWRDNKTFEEEKFISGMWPEHYAAMKEGNDWRAAYSHEFDDQKFSRMELHRWISDNSFPSLYQFSATPPKIDLSESPLSTTERNSLLIIIAALCRTAGIDHQSKGVAPKIVAMVDRLGAGLSIDPKTVSKALKQIPEAVAARGT